MKNFNYKNNILHAEDIDVREIVKQTGSPVYIYSENAFQDNLNNLAAAFKNLKHLICYSVKVASNINLLKIVARNNHGADIVSGGELFRALKAGLNPEKIVFSGVGKTEKEIAEALEAGILMFNVESEAELYTLNQIALEKNKIASFAFRVNPEINPKTHPYINTGLKESKFGIQFSEALKLYNKAKELKNLKIIGLDCHIGSQIIDLKPFKEAAQKLKNLTLELEKCHININYIDLGGGLGIKYKDEKAPNPVEYAQIIEETLGSLNKTIIIEPGRFIAGNSAVLIVNTLYKKQNEAKNFIITNGGMNDLIRPSLYNAYHLIEPVVKKNRNKIKADIVGPICESGDFFAQDREIEEVESNDLLAIFSAGSYGFAMSSNYNSRPRASEVLVNGKTFKTIRTRETYQDLIANEIN